MGAKVYPYVKWMVGEVASGEVMFGPHYAFGSLAGRAWLLLWRCSGVFDQSGSTSSSTFRRNWLGIEWLPSQINAINPIMIMVFIPIFAWLIYRVSIVFAFIIVFWSLFDQIGD